MLGCSLLRGLARARVFFGFAVGGRAGGRPSSATKRGFFALRCACRSHPPTPPLRPRRPGARARPAPGRGGRADPPPPPTQAGGAAVLPRRGGEARPGFFPHIPVFERCFDTRCAGDLSAPPAYSGAAHLRDIFLTQIETLFRRLAPRSVLWCRLRQGSGSFAAIPVKHPDQARNWIKYWQEMREIPKGLFTLSAYLPGRDSACKACGRTAS